MPLIKQPPPLQVPGRGIAVSPPKPSKVPLGSNMQLRTLGVLRGRQAQGADPRPVATPTPAQPAAPAPAQQAPVSQPAQQPWTASPVTPSRRPDRQPIAPAPPASQPVLKDMPAGQTPTVATSQARAGTSPITGNEVPYRVDPGQSDELQGLLAQLRGQVSGGGAKGDPDLQAAMKQSAMDQIANPDVYGTDLMQSAMDQARREVESFYNSRVQGVKNDLGARGLAYSAVANDDFNSVASEAGRAYQDMIRPLLRERAQSMGSARSAAFNNAMGLEDQGMRRSGQMFSQLGDAIGLQHGVEAGQREEERGERAYVDNLRRQGRSDSIEEMLLGEDMRRNREGDFQSVLQDAYRQGDPYAADRVLAEAGGRQDLAAAEGGDLLAQLAEEAFGRRRAA